MRQKEEISDRLEEIRAFNLAEAAEKIRYKKAEFSKAVGGALFSF